MGANIYGFHRSVAVSFAGNGERAAIGENFYSANPKYGTEAGRVLVYEWNGSHGNSWEPCMVEAQTRSLVAK